MEMRARARPVFELIKWYADAVSAEGDYWIGYSARLRSGGLRVSYSSVLDCDGQRHSLRPSEIDCGGSEIAWRMPALDMDTRWRGTAESIRQQLYRDDAGVVDWECLLPTARASAGRVQGVGYVERLRLTVAPWRLPIRTLRWGRFHSDRHWLVWIDWGGDFAVRCVWWNGASVAAEITDDGLTLDGGATLRLDRAMVIRGGALGKTVLGAIPGLDRVAPLRIFGVEECKWRSAATLELPGAPPALGWAIHELVTWP